MFNLFIMYENFTSGITENVLTIISILSIICGILVIISKNPVISILFLIGLFLTIAIYLMVLGISFIGLSYLLVYVGAVSILFLFILMLINVRISELTTDNNNSVPLSLIIIAVFNLVFYDKLFYSSNINNVNKYLIKTSDTSLETGDKLFNIMEYNFSLKPLVTDFLSFQEIKNNGNSVYFASSYTWDSALAETTHITSIGNVLYTCYPMLLLITSIILLLAMIGSIIITIKK